MIARIVVVGSLLLFATVLNAQVSDEWTEPGKSMVYIQIARACGADLGKVEAAAGYVADWGRRNLPDPSRLTKERVLEFSKDDGTIGETIKKKGAFIFPCSRWKHMLDLFIESKGSVMGGNQSVETSENTEMNSSDEYKTDQWNNRAGKCDFSLASSKLPLDLLYLSFSKGDPSLELDIHLKSASLAMLPKGNGKSCRFYNQIEGVIDIAGEKLAASRQGATGCNPPRNLIGYETQFLKISVKGDDQVKKVMQALVSADNVAFTLTNGPKSGHSIQLPFKGLKEVVKATTICPTAVLQAVAD